MDTESIKTELINEEIKQKSEIDFITIGEIHNTMKVL